MATNDAVNSRYITPAGGTLTGNIAFNPSTTGVGAATANNPDAGIVGERISSTIAVGSAISITSGVATNLTSMSLTAGDWDVRGNVWFIPAAGTIPSQFMASISTTSATLAPGELRARLNITMTASVAGGIDAPMIRVNVNSTTTVYLVAFTTFSVSTMTMCGRLSAVRAR